MGLSRVWQVRPRIAARGLSVDPGNPFQRTCCERVFFDGRTGTLNSSPQKRMGRTVF